MTSSWLAGAFAFATMTGGALAQTTPLTAANSTQPNLSTNGPAGTYDTTTTKRTLDSAGSQTDTSASFHKSQTYTSGNGALSAETRIDTTGPATATSHVSNNPQENPQ